MTVGKPTVSVISISYNCADTIAMTIESVRTQDYRDFEHIIVDGGSTDGTLQIIEGYRSSLATLVSERDDGVYDAMNKGRRLARGRYLIYMNGGDRFASSDALGCAVRGLKGEAEEVVFNGWIRLLSDGRNSACAPSLEKGHFNHQATLYSRSIHDWHGDYVTVDGFTTADYLFFATLFRHPRVYCSARTETVAIIDPSGVSAGLQTLMQKTAIDLLCGSASRSRVAAIALLHPFYYRVKCLLRRRP